MIIGNVTALPSVYWDHPTNMPRIIITTPTQIIGTNITCLKVSIGNKTDYYPTISILPVARKAFIHCLMTFPSKGWQHRPNSAVFCNVLVTTNGDNMEQNWYRI